MGGGDVPRPLRYSRPMRLVGILAIALACSACSSPEPASTLTDSGASDGTSDVGLQADAGDAADAADAGPPAPQFCTAETPTVVTTGAGVTATTTHYELYAETTAAEATELARLLEASSGAFESWFEKPAPLPSGKPLKVKFYKDQPSWTAGMAADGVSAPADAGGYYDPGTKTAYLYRQGNPYYTHVLLVHEATHQFHYLTRLKGQSLPFWYVEGHAEHLSRHDWDGKCVRLGVTSLLSWEDLPAQAVTGLPIDVPGIIDGSVVPTRAAAFALFRYLDKGSLHANFKAYRDAVDANTSPSFSTLVADPASLSAPVATWLPTAQEPMKPVFSEWIHVGPASVMVDSPIYFTFALVKSAVTHFEAKLEVPASGTWTAGVMVAYTDTKNYTGVVQASDGMVKTFTSAGTAIWADLGTAPLPSANVEVFSVDYGGGKAVVTFNGKAFTVTATGPVRAGLAASDMAGRFVDLGWK